MREGCARARTGRRLQLDAATPIASVDLCREALLAIGTACGLADTFVRQRRGTRWYADQRTETANESAVSSIT